MDSWRYFYYLCISLAVSWIKRLSFLTFDMWIGQISTNGSWVLASRLDVEFSFVWQEDFFWLSQAEFYISTVSLFPPTHFVHFKVDQLWKKNMCYMTVKTFSIFGNEADMARCTSSPPNCAFSVIFANPAFSSSSSFFSSDSLFSFFNYACEVFNVIYWENFLAAENEN